jgi:hypothetical protein
MSTEIKPSNLHKPLKTFPLEFSLVKLRPYLSCDKRGSATLYDIKIARYYLLGFGEFNVNANHSLFNKFTIFTNNISIPHTEKRNYVSTSRFPNTKFIIGLYLCYVFSILNKQFPKEIIDRYFKGLQQLLIVKFNALKQRLDSTSDKNRKTTTYIKFSFKKHIIYLGFYLGCDHQSSCVLPAAYVMSKRRWHCKEHENEVNYIHKRGLPRNPKYYEHKLFNDIGKAKEVTSKRLGLQYTVTKQKYNRTFDHQDTIKKHDLVLSSGRRRFFKEYKNLKFDVVRPPRQVERRNRIPRFTLNNKNPKFKTTYHPWKFVHSPLSEEHKREKNRTKNYRRRLRRCCSCRFPRSSPPPPPPIQSFNINNFQITDDNFIASQQDQPNQTPLSITRNRNLSNFYPSQEVIGMEDVTPTLPPNSIFALSREHIDILNQKDVYLRRLTPEPSDDTSIVSDETITPSSAKRVKRTHNITPPLTPYNP